MKIEEKRFKKVPELRRAGTFENLQKLHKETLYALVVTLNDARNTHCRHSCEDFFATPSPAKERRKLTRQAVRTQSSCPRVRATCHCTTGCQLWRRCQDYASRFLKDARCGKGTTTDVLSVDVFTLDHFQKASDPSRASDASKSAPIATGSLRKKNAE